MLLTLIQLPYNLGTTVPQTDLSLCIITTSFNAAFLASTALYVYSSAVVLGNVFRSISLVTLGYTFGVRRESVREE